MLPQSHAVISGLIYQDVQQALGVTLNKKQLTYGSIKPDIYSGIPKLKHFKPQSFVPICHQIAKIASTQTEGNHQAIERLSQKIGIVTHYVADYFSVPHNDRATYHHHILAHIKYETQLHHMFIHSMLERKFSLTNEYLDFSNVEHVMNYLDELHLIYSSRSESYLNDLNSSAYAARSVASLIVRQTLTAAPSKEIAA